jgi:hypothetical protein
MTNDRPHFSEADLQHLKQHGISPERAMAILSLIKRGNLFARLSRPCTIGDGIRQLSEEQIDEYVAQYRATAAEGRCSKFVPASGAATRMFKELMEILTAATHPDWPQICKEAEAGHPTYRFLIQFIKNLQRFAFFDALDKQLQQWGYRTAALLNKKDYVTILKALLLPEGLHYNALPKGLIPFHAYLQEGVRTPFEEHLAEAVAYLLDAQNRAHVHFTVTEDKTIQQQIDAVIQKRIAQYRRQHIHINVSYSVQKSATDVIATDEQLRIFREEDGKIHFRPGGHGALLENLNDLQGDIVFIKNIDNVVPEDRLADTVRYKSALGGLLISLQKRIFDYLNKLSSGQSSQPLLREIASFLSHELSWDTPDIVWQLSASEQTDYFFDRLNRPLRVCGMVCNTGEPGGGPFWVIDSTGHLSLQVVESAQINFDDAEQVAILQQSTHFSPVDFVCGLRDFRGKPFDLLNFRDPDSGFVTQKSKNGQSLITYELPGLWNGGMAFWNTVFVEVPISTFNPVKTVLDLLRPAHQPSDQNKFK